MSVVYLWILRFLLSFTTNSHIEQTHNLRPAFCRSWNRSSPLDPAAILWRIVHDWNMHVGRHMFHFDLKPTIYSSGLPTSFRNHHPHLFHNSKALQYKYLRKVGVDLNQANQPVLHPIHHSPSHSSNGITRKATVTLQMQPSNILPWMHMCNVP
jgi:hypothetical protein